MVYVVA